MENSLKMLFAEYASQDAELFRRELEKAGKPDFVFKMKMKIAVAEDI
jgi:hypothetical protein